MLSKALTSEDVHVRLFATSHLGELIRNSLSPVSWSLRLLLTQLYDPSPEVCEMAIQFLEEACDAMEVLQLVVEMQPTMDHLGEIGHPLLLKSILKRDALCIHLTDIIHQIYVHSNGVPVSLQCWLH